VIDVTDDVCEHPVLKLSRNAIPALFGKAERHTGTSGDTRGGTLGYCSVYWNRN